MHFEIIFFLNCLLGVGFAVFFFALPGLWVTALVGFEARPHKNISALFIAPILGICTYGSFALLFTWWFDFTVVSVLISWFLFQGMAATVCFNYSTSREALFTLSGSRWLLLAATLWAIVPVINIFPAIYKGGLFVNINIYDYTKIAIVDAIVREGMPPLNPFYAPAGEKIQLIYYYGWYFLASQIKIMTGISGWQAVVALNWFTGFSMMTFLSALAMRMSGRLMTGFILLLLALTGSLFDVKLHVLGKWISYWLTIPPSSHPLNILWKQLAWAPQHAFSALSSVVILFLVVRASVRKDLRWNHAVVVGMCASAGFGASIWVGGIAFLLALPVILFVLYYFLRRNSKDMIGPLCLALIVCVLFAVPILSSVMSGPTVASQFPLIIKTYHTADLFVHSPFLSSLCNIVLFWGQFLPLNLGVVFFLGIISLFALSSKQDEIRLFRAISVGAVAVYLLSVQFIQSAIINNDYGWRAVVVPILLLHVWASILLTRLCQPNFQTKMRLIDRRRNLILSFALIGIILGLLATFQGLHVPGADARHNQLTSEQLALHRDFLRQAQAWEALRRHSSPGDIVQNNPDTYATVVTLWPTSTSVTLFADRSVAYGNPETVHAFAHTYDKNQKKKQYRVVRKLFAANPKKKDLLYARDNLNIEALLIDQRDPVWPGTAIVASEVYRLAEEGKNFKIYQAR